MNKKEIITARYPLMSALEIAERYGIPAHVTYYWAHKLNITHTPDTLLRLKRKQADSVRHSPSPETRRKRSDNVKKVWRMEYFRAMSGMSRRTQLKLRLIPRRTSEAMYRLRHRRGYFSCKGCPPLTLYYDSLTTRAPNEAYYASRYGIRFEQADDGAQQQQQDTKEAAT